jgi:hypothetical protein
MANLINNNFHLLRMGINYDEYWDFFLDKDSFESYGGSSDSIYDGCLSSYIDVSDYDCTLDNTINSYSAYTWENAKSTDSQLNNVGYCGFDNGLLSFRRDMVSNKEFVNLFQNSTYSFNSDKALKLHAVSGSSLIYDYPLTMDIDYVKLNGGFFQGFFKTQCSQYQVLPTVLDCGDTWGYEFVLKKSELEKESSKTLNDKYPNNKGIFFYIGTRAENKWDYLYHDADDECFTLSPDDYVEDAHIDKKTYKINNLIEDVLEFDDYEETAMDDFLNYKYFDESLYDSYNISDYISVGEKPTVIDEEKNRYKTMQWCCGPSTTTTTFSTSEKPCRCRSCGGQSSTVTASTTTTVKKYLSKCDLFGDDFLSDIDDMYFDTDYIEDELDISDFTYNTDGTSTIGSFESYVETDNKFLLFDRTCSGYNVRNWVDGTTARYFYRKSSFKDNLFLLMNRTCTGYTVHTIDTLRDSQTEEYDVNADLYNNALAFRITDEGAVGYRYLVQDCDSEEGYSIKEGYSNNGIINEDEWTDIHVKVVGGSDTMALKFYVNGNLIFISDSLPKLNLRELNDIYEKQETVPFNISIGGGTQGLCDTVLPNYMLDPYRTYPLEENFGGSFIGYFKSFKFYNCDVEQLYIKNNTSVELHKTKNI